MSQNKSYAFRTSRCTNCRKSFSGRFAPSRRYCSRQCYYTAAAKNRKSGELKPCTLCGKSVYIHKHRLNQEVFFCSLKHHNQYQRRTKKSYACKVCAREFQKSPSFGKRGQVKYCSQLCYHSDPNTRARLIQMNVEQQRQVVNKLERQGYALLDSLGFEYKAQHLIAGKFCVDALVENKIVVQFDGDYWHGKPDRFPTPDMRQRRRIALDASQDAYLKKCGFKVVRIWESDLKRKANEVRERLLSFNQT